jgi:hypothetical protein
MMLDIWMGGGFKTRKSFAPDNYGNNTSMEWAAFVDMLRKPEIINFVPSPDDHKKAWKKGSKCFIAGLLKADPPTNKAHRKAEGMLHYSFVVLDLDGCNAEKVTAALLDNELSFAIYPTYSHNPEQDSTDRVRVVVPLNRPMEDMTKYPALVRSVALLAGGGELPAGYDDASESISQAWWLPSCPPEQLHQYLRLGCGACGSTQTCTDHRGH